MCDSEAGGWGWLCRRKLGGMGQGRELGSGLEYQSNNSEIPRERYGTN